MGHETQPASLKRQVLVAAAPNDPQAIGLVKELHILGLSTTLAETVGLASLADEAAVCIIVLHPVKWRTTPSITTAIRCNPRYMIPLLAEPMPLPNGSWATEPISIKESLAETAQELETLITGYLQTVPEPESAIVEHPSTNWPLTRSPAPFVRPPTSRKTGSWKNMRYLLLALVLLVGVSLLMRYAPHSLTLTSNQVPNQVTTTNNALLDHPYTAAVPGPGCDAGGANWQTGLYYKAPVTPTASTATTPVQGTSTLQVVTDNSIVTTCQQNGLLVKHTAHFDLLADVFFASDGLALPHHFSTQITATIVAATGTADLDLGVRNQAGAPTTNGPNNGYGKERETMRDDSVEPTQAEREQAKVRPSFWVYKIVGDYGRDDAVPPEAIAGAWQVDAQGNIFGDFIPNPNYRGPREEGEEVQSPSLGAMKAAQLGPGSVVSESEAQVDERAQKKQP